MNKKIVIAILVVVVIVTGAAYLLGVFYTTPSNNPSVKSSMAEFTGEVSGLPPSSTGTTSKSATLNIVDPATVQIITGREIKGNFSSYQIEISPGRRMAILKVWDFDSRKMYVGASRAFNISMGESHRADIALKEAGTFNDISAAVSIQSAVLNIIHTLFKSLITYAAEEKPVLVVIHKSGPHGPYLYEVSVIETILAIDGNYVQAIDEQSLGAVEEERNLKILAPDSYGDFTPRNPNFVVELDIKFKVNVPQVTISLINTEDQKVIWKDTTDEDATHLNLDSVVALASDKLVASLSGKGPNPVQFPKFTPSVPNPVKSLAEWGAKMRQALGPGKQSESSTSGVGSQTDAESQSQPPPPATFSCNIPAFRVCANIFSLQGCIEACPYVPATCPPGTPPDTDCKETDKTCSDICWSKADAHIDNCLASSKCTKEEVIAGGGGAQR